LTHFHCSTWTEFASDVNGKKLSKLVGQTDEEKLIDLCNAIDRQVQQLRPYQPIAKSQVLSKLCCRIPHHHKLPLFVACSGASQPRFPRAMPHTPHPACPPSVHGLLCSECMYEHNRTTCNVRPVKLVEIVEKWESAHKIIESRQTEFKTIRCNIECDFPQTSALHSQAQVDLFVTLRERFAFFSDSASTSIAQALTNIENRLIPFHSVDPVTECVRLLFISCCRLICK
jgi:hypothetical protein